MKKVDISNNLVFDNKGELAPRKGLVYIPNPFLRLVKELESNMIKKQFDADLDSILNEEET